MATIENLTDKQAEVYRLARAELQKQPWYNGVMIESIPEHEVCQRRQIEAVSIVVAATTERDGPK